MKKDKIILLFTSVFYTGHVPFASGTVATLIGGVPLYIALSRLEPAMYLVVLIILCLLSIYLSHCAEVILQEKDSSKIVIDEVIGYLVALVYLPVSWKIMVIAFVLFRVFDISKLFPVNLVERKVSGGAGIVLDDVAAGLYANAIVQLTIRIFPDFYV